MKKLAAGLTCLVLLGLVAKGQSIYSFEGLGSLEHQGMPNNFMMGEVGIGTPTRFHINTQNPANLVYNTFSTFQVGLEVDRRSFSGDGVSGTDTEGSLRFLGYAFPIMFGKWSSSIGILPYSTVNYNTFSEGVISGTGGEEVTQISDNRGEGGLTHFYWANGFRIKKKLLVGIRANYTFGSINKESTISIGGADVPISNVSFEDQESYSDINFLFGLGYRHEFTEEKYLNFGVTYSPQSSLNGTSELSLLRLSSSGQQIESTEVSNTEINQDLPQSLGFGMSYQRLNNYKIGLDVELQQWGSVERGNDTFTDFSKIALGVEWIPDYDDVGSYFQRAKYAIGINRTKLPYVVNEQSLIDFGINFGASLPVSGFSSIDLGFKWGQLGETGNDLIRENYYKIVIGATINDRWFIKRR